LKFSKTEPISRLAAHQVSQFLYQQGHKANEALDATFSAATDEREVLFYLPITKTWLFQLILGLILVCHCSYRWNCWDLFDLPISVGTIHNRLQSADKAAAINLTKTCLQSEWDCRTKYWKSTSVGGVDASQLTATYWRRLNTGMRTLGSASTGC